MIGKLTGKIDIFETAHLILDVGGVGYLVHASRRTLSSIGQKGEVVSLYIETLVREDAITLYGFMDQTEQQCFRILTSVQGVGAKVGLSILSVAPPEKIALAIAAQDKAFISQADGVGPKLAVRICTELKDKMLALQSSGLAPASGGKSQQPIASAASQDFSSGLDHDAISALVNLGYGRSDAFTAVQKAREKANDNLQDLIKQALKELAG